MGSETPEAVTVNGDGFRCGYCDAPVHDLDRALVAWVGLDPRTFALLHEGCVEAFDAERNHSIFWYTNHPSDLLWGIPCKTYIPMASRGPENALHAMRRRLGEEAADGAD